VLGLVAYIPELARFFEHGITGAISSVQVLLQAVAIYLLFNNDSKLWFESKKIKRQQ
jgi:hypothetical protein